MRLVTVRALDFWKSRAVSMRCGASRQFFGDRRSPGSYRRRDDEKVIVPDVFPHDQGTLIAI